MTVAAEGESRGKPVRGKVQRPFPRATRKNLEGPARALEKSAIRALRVPADRSTLRRSLGKPPSHPMVQPAHKLVARHLPRFFRDVDERDVSETEKVALDAIERAFYTVAALIAAQPRESRDAHLAVNAGDLRLWYKSGFPRRAR